MSDKRSIPEDPKGRSQSETNTFQEAFPQILRVQDPPAVVESGIR